MPASCRLSRHLWVHQLAFHGRRNKCHRILFRGLRVQQQHPAYTNLLPQQHMECNSLQRLRRWSVLRRVDLHNATAFLCCRPLTSKDCTTLVPQSCAVTAIGGTGSSRVGNVTVVSIGTYTVALAWTVTDVSATRFEIFYTSNLNAANPVLSQVAPPSAIGNRTPTSPNKKKKKLTPPGMSGSGP